MNLLKSTGIIGGMTLISRLFGFARDMLISRLLGGTALGDAWQIAFQLPNIFRRLFAEGAFSAAFVPLFNRKLAQNGDGGKAAAGQLANETLSVFIPILLIFSIIMMMVMPWAIWLIDDFGEGGRSTPTAITLARITFPYLAFVSIMTLFGAILNSISKFAAVAFAPVLMNLCMIGAMLIAIFLGYDDEPEQIAYWLAWSVCVAGILQMSFLYAFARRAGFRFSLLRPRFTTDVRELGVLILPAIFGAGIYQISRFIDLFFLGTLEEGSFVFLALADRLNQLPLGIIGIALGTAILPALSRYIATDDQGGAQRVQSNAIELGLLLTVPAAVGLFFAAQPLVSAFTSGIPVDTELYQTVVRFSTTELADLAGRISRAEEESKSIELALFDGGTERIVPAPDARQALVIRAGGEAAVVDLRTWRLSTRLPGRITTGHWLPDGTLRTAGDHLIDWGALATTRGIRYPGPEGVSALAHSDGRVAIGRGDGSLEVVELASGAVRYAQDAHTGVLKDLAFEPAGQRLLFHGLDPATLSVLEGTSVQSWPIQPSSRVAWLRDTLVWTPYSSGPWRGPPGGPYEQLPSARYVDVAALPDASAALLLDRAGGVFRLEPTGEPSELGRFPGAIRVAPLPDGFVVLTPHRIAKVRAGVLTWLELGSEERHFNPQPLGIHDDRVGN